MLKRITSLMIFIAIVFGQQSKSGLELEESIIQKVAEADAKEDFNSGLKWSALSMDSRLNTLYTKNEKHRSIYQTAYEKEIRKQRLKYSLLATGYCTVSLGVYAAAVYYLIPYGMSYH